MPTEVVKAVCLLLPLLFHESKAGSCNSCNCLNCCSTISPTSYIPCPSRSTTDCSTYTTIENDNLQTTVPAPMGQTTSPGAIIGAAFGGAVCGSVVTVVVFMCMRRKPSLFKKTNPVCQFNDGNQQNPSRDLNTKSVVYNEINDDLQRVVQPMQHQEASCITEGVYNHLHTPDQEDRSDYSNYDHAGPTPSLPNKEEGYGVLPSDSKSNENYSKVDPATTPDCKEPIASEYAQTSKESNEYFTLERMNNC